METSLIASFLCFLLGSVPFLCKKFPKLFIKLQKCDLIKDCIVVSPCTGYVENRTIKTEVTACYMGIAKAIQANVSLFLLFNERKFMDSCTLDRKNHENNPKWNNPILLDRGQERRMHIEYELPNNIPSVDKVNMFLNIEYKNLIGKTFGAQTDIIGYVFEHGGHISIAIKATPQKIVGTPIYILMQ